MHTVSGRVRVEADQNMFTRPDGPGSMTSELSESESDELLCEAGVGVLAVTDGSDAYSVPESFGYDGERLYFQFVYTDDSKKMAFLEETETVSFTVHEATPARSVIVQGEVERVPDDDESRAATAIAENASIPTLNVYPGTGPDDIDIDYYQLTPSEITGRQFELYTPQKSE